MLGELLLLLFGTICIWHGGWSIANYIETKFDLQNDQLKSGMTFIIMGIFIFWLNKAMVSGSIKSSFKDGLSSILNMFKVGQ